MPRCCCISGALSPPLQPARPRHDTPCSPCCCPRAPLSCAAPPCACPIAWCPGSMLRPPSLPGLPLVRRALQLMARLPPAAPTNPPLCSLLPLPHFIVVCSAAIPPALSASAPRSIPPLFNSSHTRGSPPPSLLCSSSAAIGRSCPTHTRSLELPLPLLPVLHSRSRLPLAKNTKNTCPITQPFSCRPVPCCLHSPSTTKL